MPTLLFLLLLTIAVLWPASGHSQVYFDFDQAVLSAVIQ